MDGPWQICQKTPDEYGRMAKETAKLMRWVDPTIELAACGSSAYDMPTYGVWEDRVLEHCFEFVDYLSLHSYFVKPPADPSTESFFAQIETNARYIEDTVAIADSVATRKRSTKRLMLSFDEWNVWYRARHGEHLRQAGWPEAPRLLEEVYTAEDALLIGGMLTMFMNHADRLKVACMAQLCNVIAPIMTTPGGPAWRQTIFHPFAQAARWARGQVLRPVIRSPGYTNLRHGELPYLCASVVDDAATGQTAVFVLNRSLTDEMELSVTLRGLGSERALVQAEQLHSADIHATNTADAPDRVAPQPLTHVLIDGEQLRMTLKPASWNVIVTKAVRA
jgi:alpha-N-arabinofuranosidase